MIKALLIVILTLVGASSVHAHDELRYTKNNGQWHENVLFRAKMNFGNIYLEKDGFTYQFYDKAAVSRENHTKEDYQFKEMLDAHVVQTKFINSNPNPQMESHEPSSWYENYYIGSDKSKWQTDVRSYKAVVYRDLYDYIDLKMYQYANYAKYDFIVAVGGSPYDIAFQYSGYDDVYIKNGSMHIKTSMGEIIEKAPLAYQVIDGKEVEVPCKYVLDGDVVRFEFPQDYDDNYELIIDPILVFSTYTGSTSDNWGFTATYDNAEFAYAGGIVFGAGYPTTTGAYQLSFAAGTGTVDIGITKFLPDGSGLVYSTYLGGTGAESPHSLVVDNFDNLFVLSTTSSTDFPTTVGAYDQVFNGGVAFTPNFYTYHNGSDIAITKFNANGTNLIGSTFVGGSANDGTNANNGIRYFYGDQFRGEIIVDGAGNAVVSSCTRSIDFPVTGNAPQPANGGGLSDAVVFRLNPGLTALTWSTYWGGTGADTGFGIQLDSNGDIFVSGATASADLFTTPTAMNATNMGGIDGYLSKFSANGSTVLGSTYIGTSSNDYTFFIQIDDMDDAYIIGVSEGSYPVTAGLYSNPNSNQFIQKLTNDLSTNIWSTVVGTGNGTVDVSPTAFLVNDCGLIYWSGWGGTVNSSSVPSSTTTGLPVTTGATTSGSDFYFMVLEQNAQSLLYATFLGGISGDHVDGGTSRFDKKGIIYHAVCAGCGGNSSFPSTPGVWSTTNNSSNCNLSVFKFGINNIQTLITIPQPYVCIPNSYTFNNSTTGANTYQWYFGDGDSSSLFSPSHLYQDTGHYTVTLIASDSTGCILADTAYIEIDVYAINDGGIIAVPPICPGDSVDLEAYGGAVYTWYPNTNLINGGTSTATVHPDVTTTYFVIVHDSCSTDTASIVVTVFQNTASTSPDTIICAGQDINISAFGGTNYDWLPSASLSSLTTQTTNASPLLPTWYYVDVTTADGCVIRDSVFVDVIATPPAPILPNDTVICLGDTLQLNATGATTILWESNYNISSNGPLAKVWPTTDFYYVASFSNVCATLYDSVLVMVDEIFPTVSNDTTICPGDSAFLIAGGGNAYIWTPSGSLSDPTNDTTYAFPSTPTTYNVEVSNVNGCVRNVDVLVDLFPLPPVNAGPDAFIEYGEEVTLNGSTNAHLFWWSPADSLSCDDCLNPTANPGTLTEYVLYAIDGNGCENSDTVKVYIDAVLYVPNAFTPNGDGINDVFYAFGKEIKTFEMTIFDRWGQVVFQTSSLNYGWDGRYKNIQSPLDVYVWKIKYSDYINPEVDKTQRGHVTLVR